MRKLLSVAVMLSFLALPRVAAAAGPTAAPIVLKAARVFTATAERPLAPGMVIVEGDHIAKVGQGLAVPPGAQVIDLGDATLLPGFIDAHVHLSMEMSDDWYRDFYQGRCGFPPSRRCMPPSTPGSPSRPASPPCATWAPPNTSLSGCATRSTPASPRDRAC